MHGQRTASLTFDLSFIAGRGIACLAMLVQSAAIVPIVPQQLSGGVRGQRRVLKPDSQLTKGLT